MPVHCSEYDAADHERDLRKHDFPIRLEPARLTTALDIALIVRKLDNLQEGAKLIQQYADMVAAGAALDEANRLGNRIVRSIESPLSRSEPVR